MKSSYFVFLFVLLGLPGTAQWTMPDLSASKAAIQKAQKAIAAYHAGATPAGKVVKVIYFHGNDLAPLPDYEQRMNRILKDVSHYYQEQFNKYGVASTGVPFEKAGDKYVITTVQGDLPSQSYNTESGMVMQNEISKKAGNKINFATDHVLIIGGFCYRSKEGVHMLHAPTWGTGSNRNGICYSVDCELLDPQLLTDTVHRMTWNGLSRAFTYAEFNSWFIGCMAHEMGHMFGLPHDYGNPAELAVNEISLMGQYGSRHYRDHLWRGPQSATLTAAGILQLISHPLFTQSAKGLEEQPAPNLPANQYINNEQGVLIKAPLPATNRPYACYSLFRTSDVSEYFGRSTMRTLGGGQEHSIPLGKLTGGGHTLTLMYLYPNGATRFTDNHFIVRSTGLVETPRAFAWYAVDEEAFYNRLRKEDSVKNAQKLKILRSIMHPVEPADPSTASGDSLLLSDAKWEKAHVGWRYPARNHTTPETERVFFLESGGKLYEHGLYAHAPSTYNFNLGKKWMIFTAIAANRDDVVTDQGPVRFRVYGDGLLLYTTPDLNTGQQIAVNVDVRGVEMLELKALPVASHNGHCWSIWLDPMLTR